MTESLAAAAAGATTAAAGAAGASISSKNEESSVELANGCNSLKPPMEGTVDESSSPPLALVVVGDSGLSA